MALTGGTEVNDQLRAPAGTPAGYVPKTTTGGKFIYVPEGSIGTGLTVLYSKWDSFIPDASPHALTEEFDSTDLSAFTQIYTGDTGVTVDADTTVPGSLWLELPTQNYRMRAFVKALPGDSEYTIHSAVNIGGYHGKADGAYPGIILSSTATAGAGNQTGCSFNYDSSNFYGQRSVLYWSNWGNDASNASLPLALGGGGMFCFLRLRKVSSTYYFAWSVDGRTWHERSQALLSGFTPTHFGLQAQNYTGQVARVSFPYMRYYATGTQLYTGALRDILG